MKDCAEQQATDRIQERVARAYNENECCTASREKYWSELSIEEKIERTRSEVKQYQRSVAQIGDQFYNLMRQFGTHQHGESGLILIPLEAFATMEKSLAAAGYQGMLGRGPKDNQEVYF